MEGGKQVVVPETHHDILGSIQNDGAQVIRLFHLDLGLVHHNETSMFAENHAAVEVDFSDATSKEVGVSNENDGLVLSGVLEELAEARIILQLVEILLASRRTFAATTIIVVDVRLQPSLLREADHSMDGDQLHAKRQRVLQIDVMNLEAFLFVKVGDKFGRGGWFQIVPVHELLGKGRVLVRAYEAFFGEQGILGETRHFVVGISKGNLDRVANIRIVRQIATSILQKFFGDALLLRGVAESQILVRQWITHGQAIPVRRERERNDKKSSVDP